jgi:hypothetical protein
MRTQAYFSGSRLYRQADKGATHILQLVDEVVEPYKEILRCISASPVVEVDTAADLKSVIGRLESWARDFAAGLSPYHTLPVLLEAVDRAYYGDQADHKSYGPALKTAISLVYSGVSDRSARQRVASHEAIARLVFACGLLTDLIGIERAWDHASGGRLMVEPTRVRPEGELAEVVDAFANAYAARGRVLRLASDASWALTHARDSLRGVLEVLAGVDPRDSEFLRGSVLGKLPDRNMDFWAGLLVRLTLMAIAAETRAQAATGKLGVAIIGSAPIVFPRTPGIDWKLTAQEMFCNQAWHRRQPLELYPNLPIRRPLLRITPDEELFATSIGCLADGVTSYLERAVFRDEPGAKWLLHEDCFRTLISEPFERDTAATLRQVGFRAGRVTEAGHWEGGHVDLSRIAGRPPGEIDVLAHHPSGMLIVAECKVLSLPFQRNRLRNLVAKLGAADSEGFRAKLRAKVAWAQDAMKGHSLLGHGQGLIVLDQMVPGLQDTGSELVVLAEDLAPALELVIARMKG